LQNAAQNFDTETMMSISSFSGSDSGDGNYLKVLSQPVNVLQNSRPLIAIIQSIKVTNDTARDPGAAMRDALSSSFGLTSPDAAGILYLVSRRYVDGGPTVKEIDMMDALVGGNMTLICVEGSSNDTNNILNLNRIARLTEGYHFTNTPDQGSSWRNINGQASDKLVALSKEPINSIRRMVIKPYKRLSAIRADELNKSNTLDKFLDIRFYFRLVDQNILELWMFLKMAV